jgi:hypothetical protein
MRGRKIASRYLRMADPHDVPSAAVTTSEGITSLEEGRK